MFSKSNSLFRFLGTFGLFFLVFFILWAAYGQVFYKHIVETGQITALKAKSQILGYQTPNFKLLAQDLLETHIFNPGDLNNYENGAHFLSFYKKGSELFPELFEMSYMEGICHFWDGDLPLAEASLRKSLKINPYFFWSNYNLGLLYLKNGQLDAAIALLSIAQKIPPPLTEKWLHDLQAFFIIWKFMPDPQNYIKGSLQKADQRINDLLMI